MKVYVAGVGMGTLDSLTGGCREAVLESDIIFGGERMLETARQVLAGAGRAAGEYPQLATAISAAPIVKHLSEDASLGTACVLCSGDVGFFSLATSLVQALSEMDQPPQVELVPGLTTVQYLAARIGRPWQGIRLASAHGRDCDVLGEVLARPEVFLLTGGEQTARNIIGYLDQVGLGDAQVVVGGRLSYEDERITCGTAHELAGQDFDSLAALIISRGPLGDAEVQPYRSYPGIPDELFIRGKAPMTKSEVRSLVVSKLRPGAGEVIYDIGAGTGSVSVELACADPRCRVWAIEFKEDALELLEQNRTRFGALNMAIVGGRAPEALEGLPAPDAVFIGGSTGEMEQILRQVLAANPAARLVITAVSMETVAQATGLLQQLAEEGLLQPYAATQVGITRTKEAGSYHLLSPESPVFIFEAQGMGAREGERG